MKKLPTLEELEDRQLLSNDGAFAVLMFGSWAGATIVGGLIGDQICGEECRDWTMAGTFMVFPIIVLPTTSMIAKTIST